MTTCEQIAGCEPDLDVVADMARTVAWNVTDPAMFDQLVRLCQQQPHRAAQVLMALAAWHDFAPVRVLGERAEMDRWAVRVVVHERIPMRLGVRERDTAARALWGVLPASQIAALIGCTTEAVLSIHKRAGFTV